MISLKNTSFKISVGIRNATDFSPFGVELKGRNFEVSGGGNYRFGFNGMEADNDVKGEGNSYTTEFRQYDPRLGRWLSLDPKTHHEYSPYSAFDNNPIYYVDPEGADSEGENKEDLNTNEPPKTLSTEETPLPENKLPVPPAFKDNYDKILSDPVGTKYSDSQREKLSSQFSGYASMEKTKVEGGKSTFKLTAGKKMLFFGSEAEGTVTMEKSKIVITHLVNDKWVKEHVDVVKLVFSGNYGFLSETGKDKVYHTVFIYGDKAFAYDGEQKQFLPKFKLD